MEATLSPEALSKSLLSRHAQLQTDLANQIKNLPDNPKIKRMNTPTGVFIISYQNLENNLSPEYYDFKIQYQQISEMIQHIPPHKVERFIGELTMSTHYHDNVKKHLITLWKKGSPDNHIS